MPHPGEFSPRVLPDWVAPTLLGAWVPFVVPPNNPVGYFRDPMGFVHIRGCVQLGAIGTPVFTLPAGFRPFGNELLAQPSNGLFGYCAIFVNGDVQPQVGSNVWFSLDGIVFRANA